MCVLVYIHNDLIYTISELFKTKLKTNLTNTGTRTFYDQTSKERNLTETKIVSLPPGYCTQPFTKDKIKHLLKDILTLMNKKFETILSGPFGKPGPRKKYPSINRWISLIKMYISIK